MIIFTCPYEDCDGHDMLPIGDIELPVVALHKCEECKRRVYTRLSRVDPMSWTEESWTEESMKETYNKHDLYTDKDFTKEEAEKETGLYIQVVENVLSICKKCGSAEIELREECGCKK